MIETAVTSQLTQASASFSQEQGRVTMLAEQLRRDISTVSEGKLAKVLTLHQEHEASYLAHLAKFEARIEGMLVHAQAFFKNDSVQIHHHTRHWAIGFEARVEKMARFVIG